MTATYVPLSKETIDWTPPTDFDLKLCKVPPSGAIKCKD